MLVVATAFPDVTKFEVKNDDVTGAAPVVIGVAPLVSGEVVAEFVVADSVVEKFPPLSSKLCDSSSGNRSELLGISIILELS